jgi:hypothetical protein
MLVSLAVDTSAQSCSLLIVSIGLIGLPGCASLPAPTPPPEPVENIATPASEPQTSASTESSTENSAEQSAEQTSTSTLPRAPDFAPVARVQRVAPFRHVSEFMSAADWQSLKTDTVGLKICAPSAAAAKTVEVADASPVAMLNDAAIAWGRASQWEIVNGEGASYPVCTFVIARFGR